MEVQPKFYYGLKTMTSKFRKYGQGENIAVHLKYVLTYYIKYAKEEDRIKSLIGLINKKRVERVVATEVRNANVSKNITMEHCFIYEGKQEITKTRKISK